MGNTTNITTHLIFNEDDMTVTIIFCVTVTVLCILGVVCAFRCPPHIKVPVQPE